MKKILIGLLICIPLIIVFAIDVSGDIIATSTDITIEEITLYHDGNLIDDVIEIEVKDYVNRAYRLEAVTYPSIAKKELKWISSDMGIATVDENGDVKFTGQAFGEVKIFCESKNNHTIRATATFYVSGSELYSIQIVKDGEEEYQSAISMEMGETIRLGKIVLPAPAIKEKKTLWSSSNISVATIDGNGVVTALSNGVTTISARVYEPERDEYLVSEVTLTVNTSNRILKKEYLTITTDSVNLSSFAYTEGFALVDVVGEATVDGTILNYTGTEVGEVILKVEKGNRVEDLKVRFTKGAIELTFTNLEYLLASAWSEGAYANLMNYEFSLVAEVANDDYVGEAPVVIYTVSDNSILSRESDGSLLGLTSGLVTVTAEANGFVSKSLEVEVKTPLEYVAITIDNDEDERGVEGTRVWGNKFAVRVDALSAEEQQSVVRPTIDFMYGYVNTYKFEIATYRPAGADLTFTYYSTNEEYATVDANGVITFKEASIGNQVGVYMVAKYSYGANAARDGYVFNVVDGINLGWEIKETDDCVNLEKLTAHFNGGEQLSEEEATKNFDIAMMFAYFEESWYAEYDRPENCIGGQLKRENVVLQCDVYYRQDHWIPYILTSIYGNGFKIDSRFKKHEGDENFVLKMNRALDGEIVFQNLTLNSAYPPSDNGDWTSLKENGGYIAGIGNRQWEDMEYHYGYGCGCGGGHRTAEGCSKWEDKYWEQNTEKDENGKTKMRDATVTFRYCQIQNTFNSIVVKRGNVLVEGCIFRNTVSASIMYSPESADVNKYSATTSLTVRNCIFANSLAPAIMITPPVTGVTSPELINVSIEGKNYIYNWKKIKDIDLALLEDKSLPIPGMANTINGQINDIFKKVLTREEYDDMKVKNRETGSARNEDYVNLTICAFGMWYDSSKLPMNYNESEWKSVYADVNDMLNLAGFSKYPIQLLMNYSDSETFNTMPGENYDTASDENGNPIWMKRLRGQA